MGMFGRVSLSGLLAPANAAPANTARDRAWADIQRQAGPAFALLTREQNAGAAELARAQMDRLHAFHHLFNVVALFIRTHIAEDERRSSRYAFALFTLAHYAELSGDLWYARDFYTQVCELAAGLAERRQPIPAYNQTSILRLCQRQLGRLAPVLSRLGRRPTRVTVLQSEDEPGPEEFANAFRGLSERDRPALHRIWNPGQFALIAAAIDRAEANRGCRNICFAAAVARSFAEQRNLPFHEVRSGRILVAGVGVPRARARTAGMAMNEVARAFEAVHGPLDPERVPMGLIMRGAMSSEDLRLFAEAASDEPRLALHLGPVLMPAGNAEFGDYPLFYGRRLAQPLPDEVRPWIDVTLLYHPGAGAYAVPNAATLLRAMIAATDEAHVLPFYECPFSVPAVRVCILHRSMFARFLMSRASRTAPRETALRSYVAGLPAAGGDAEAVKALVARVTGLPPAELRAAFLAYVDAQGGGARPPSEEVRVALGEVARAFGSAEAR